MSRGRHRHSPPLHKLLPPSAVAGAAVVCAAVAWLPGDPVVARVLAAAAAAAAVIGAVLMRSWDRDAGLRVAELDRARTADQWKTEERIAELESDLEESRALRARLDAKLRAKRVELAGLRGEHADLLRRYATAETQRASALEGRRVRALETTGPAAEDSALARALPAAGSTPTPESYRRAAEALRDLSNNATAQRSGARDLAERPQEPGKSQEPKPQTAQEPREPQAPRTAQAPQGEQPVPDDEHARSASTLVLPRIPATTQKAAPGTPVPPAAPSAPTSATAGPTTSATVVPTGTPATPATPAPAAPSAPAAPAAGPGTSASVATPGAAVPPGTPASATTPGAAATPVAPGTPVPPAAQAPQAPQPTPGTPHTPVPPVTPALPGSVPVAAAIVPYAARRPVPRPEGGFDFFGTQKTAAAIEAVQHTDLADVVGEEVLEEVLAAQATTGTPLLTPVTPAGAPAAPGTPPALPRTVGQVIDLTAHDETEQLDVAELRGAVNS
ncbi:MULTISPECIES: hypothetical protein [unclassified Streptomyces]|uniref:hypothetical protein n=1 Tax=unclassified Streptomyces TaxID=2593676 RepID=UPI0016612A31|nr:MULTISPECIES: hypothetical protein [unclassified Streptomyces]MBD0707628.1 hypothetical protein [Streptomyces sp. CBMA291]MBD0713407.1 hypothetical protein [Streptomyces sp. CBMA370]